MNISDFVIQLFTPAGFIQLMQFLTVFLEIVYIIFAFIVVRQVRLMNKSFQTGAAGLFTLIAFTHFFVAVGLVAISLLIL